MVSKEELTRRIGALSEDTSAEEASSLFDDLNDYLNDAYTGPKPWDDSTGDVTPEYIAWEKKALEDLGTDTEIFDTLNMIQEVADKYLNPATRKTVIDRDGDGDADVTITEQYDGDDDESLIIGGTDIFKTPFTEKQLAILRGDSDYTKYSKDEFDALQAADYPKARTARNAWIKRARELLDGDDDKPHDQGLAGDTTLEEELMLKPSMKPTEFSKKAAEKRRARPGEPAPDMNLTNDIAKMLASRRW